MDSSFVGSITRKSSLNTPSNSICMHVGQVIVTKKTIWAWSDLTVDGHHYYFFPNININFTKKKSLSLPDTVVHLVFHVNKQRHKSFPETILSNNQGIQGMLRPKYQYCYRDRALKKYKNWWMKEFLENIWSKYHHTTHIMRIENNTYAVASNFRWKC